MLIKKTCARRTESKELPDKEIMKIHEEKENNKYLGIW